MKKILLLAILAIAMTKANAQYYNNVSPQVMYDPCVQASIAAANSSNWVMQNNYNIMQQQQWMMQNGYYNTHQRTGRYVETRETCDNCNGEGFIYRTVYMGGGETRTVKRRCGFCHGTGSQRKSRYVSE